MIDYLFVKSFIKGLLTFIPGVNLLLEKKRRRSLHSGSMAEFCYTFWLSILVFVEENNAKINLTNIGEIGAGGSLGIGFCALLTGTQKYYALEINTSIDIEKNIRLLDEILILFKNKTPISKEFKQINVQIKNHDFPEALIKPNFYQNELVNNLKNVLKDGIVNNEYIQIINKWEESTSLNLNFVFSRAVMEHVKNPLEVYQAIHHHLLESTYMLHDIELHSHEITRKPNGHYNIQPKAWFIIFGKRGYFLNRWTLSDHIIAIEKCNFSIEKTHQSLREFPIWSEKIVLGAVILAKIN